MVAIPVILKGVNYLVWSRMVKTSLGGMVLLKDVADGEASKKTVQVKDDVELVLVDDGKWG